MRALDLSSSPSSGLSDEELAALYEPPQPHWLRAVFVATLDGAATGSDGKSGTINNDVDHRIFGLLRSRSDAVLVGASTAAIEGYAGLDKPLVLISRSGEVPPQLRSEPAGTVRIVVPANAPRHSEAVDILGAEHVIVAGQTEIDLVLMRQMLHRDHPVINCEGGPRILGALLGAGVVDEIDLTITPLAVGGDHPRIVAGESMRVDFDLTALVEQDSTLVGRWIRRRPTRG